MTDLQKQMIEIAGDKTLSIGCFIIAEFNDGSFYLMKVIDKDKLNSCGKQDLFICASRYDDGTTYVVDSIDISDYNIIGHPIHFGHLMKLNKESQNSLARGLFDKILNRFNNNLHLYSQDCLSWDEETNQLILNYLLTVKGK